MFERLEQKLSGQRSTFASVVMLPCLSAPIVALKATVVPNAKQSIGTNSIRRSAPNLAKEERGPAFSSDG